MKLRNTVIALFVLAILGEILFIHPHDPHEWWQRVPGFHALLGLIAGVISITAAKALGKYILYRKVTYYEKPGGKV
ncbi:MAG: hypothetical protein Q8R76_01535 [Candidatus Omnitrophota bacterium]|nr:hypothetical protein [Candidatus Omnitrophota bacterium]